ncbi:MAG: NirD/YgiW/YdeI family stress tolerance protein [Spirochaetaceae bacterium]|jgi:uncharacterized protein (TIGR00156 family)|nr:NirD/YgiW/YdeI family stress tolerance protein [Spirochaetaceae bacterium]
MKKRILFCSLAVLICAAFTVFAQDGYKGPASGLVTVADTKNMKDNSPVILRGKIDKFLGDEKYLFADSTGTITIEIDNELWRGLSVDQNDTVEISGEVDRELTSIKIDVSTIKKI